MKIVIGITGASGSIYAKKLIEFLEKTHELFVIISDEAKKIFKNETGEKFVNFIENTKVKVYKNNDLHAPLASGSFKIDAFVIVPCSVKTLSAIANGYASNLICRCADVTIKENRKIILVVRETPFSAIHLENMLKLARLGVTILPPIPAFYTKPKSMEEIVNFVVGKILDNLNIEHSLFRRWE